MKTNADNETVERLAEEMVEAFIPAIYQLLAKAWDEGWESAAMQVPEGVRHDTASDREPNPYRSAQTTNERSE